MKLQDWFKSGNPWIWLNAAAVSASLIMVFGLLGLIMVRGLGFFWPADVHTMDYVDEQAQQVRLMGEIWGEEDVDRQVLIENGVKLDIEDEFITRYTLKTGNRDIYGADFRLILKPNIQTTEQPDDAVVVVRREWGNFYGFLDSIKEQGMNLSISKEKLWSELENRTERVLDLHDQIVKIQKSDIGDINHELEKLRLQKRRYEIDNELTPQRIEELAAARKKQDARYADVQKRLNDLNQEINRDSILMRIVDGQIKEIPLEKVVKIYRPNQMSVFTKTGTYFANIWEFVSDEPREANTEGGVFPAIFGTVMMVMIMAVLVTPLGVIAAVYLREYAKQGALTRTIRIAVNNLAGVPSIVYGVFGLGFFVYFLGGNIDRLFFSEGLPAPTFGTPGILWSSLTLAILTLPVVIVATEEGLSRIPKSIREGSLALGATKFETLWRTIIPMSSPAIMTGLILAVARAAGEVAPLMLVGVVKLAPSLPVDGTSPFVHLDRKFMHLGFHIYDVGFQSPNVEAARPLVYATSLLLVLVIIALNIVAIYIRNRLREKYRALES
ncbi:Phosphate transport system permease protein PstA (TC 3.A.1.7.1) [hydrothermal vent metagenome]|uniref:Phosphate transport system permease protein PstA (TC 3.A.1.7.1) n=1 Tax=hydrothermal vent metagenome TaxID=652676 RepID=A0A3B1A6G7_9ZZZZ